MRKGKRLFSPSWGGRASLPAKHLIVRGFALSNLEVEYPYDVPPGGRLLEQIDGLVYLNCYTFLLECKDKETTDIEAIAKLRNQLLRRPETTFGCVKQNDFAGALRDTYRHLCRYGLTDHSPYYKELQV